MNWNVGMPIWSVGAFVVLPFSLLLAAFVALWLNACGDCEIVEENLSAVADERDEARRQRDTFEKDSKLFGEAVVAFNEEKITLKALNADLHDSLADKEKHIRMLQGQTVEMPEVATQAPIRVPKRPVRTKAKTKVEESR